MLWMPYIHAALFGAVAFVPEWRRTCLIIFLMAVANILYQPITAAASLALNYNVPAVYAFTDFITIIALLIWGRKGSLLQASVLTAFIAVNFALLLDYKSPPYPVYDNYSQVIFALNLTQIALISGGIYAMVRRTGDTIKHFLGGVRYGRHSGGPAGSGRSQHSDKIS